jgi:hypothetical protein
MFTYCFVLTDLFISALISSNQEFCRWRRAKFVLAFLNALILALFIGLRDEVGGDWESYATILQNYCWPFSMATWVLLPIEPGYLSLDIFSNFFGGGLYLVNFICAAIILMCLIKYSSLMEVNPNLVLFLAAPYILFVVGMNYSRQSVAISISFVALAYLTKGKTRAFYSLALLAVCFHFTAATLIVFTPFRNKFYRIFAFMAAGLIFSFVLFRYPVYLQGNESLDSKGVWLRMSMLVLGVIMFIVQRRHWKHSSNAYRIFKKSSVIIVCLLVLSFEYSTIADRIGLYFMFLYITVAGNAMRYSPRHFKILNMALVTGVTYGVFFVWFGMSSAAALWVPYKNLLYRYL